jgi:hypothetical protein
MKHFPCVLLALSLAISLNANATQYVTTHGAGEKDWSRFFTDHFIVVERHGDGVHLKSDRQLSSTPIFTKLTHEVTLQPGGEFFLPDKHGRNEFVLKKVAPDGAVFDYKSDFHANDFGDDKVTLDSGTIKVPWKP